GRSGARLHLSGCLRRILLAARAELGDLRLRRDRPGDRQGAHYLKLAERLADHYLGRLDEGLVPYWDFDDPAIPDAPHDSSASAILAAALLDLAALHPEAEAALRRAEQACRVLDALCRDYLARDPRHRGLLEQGCYSRPHDEGVASAVLFGDFYFTEALCKALLPGHLQPAIEPLRT
ncbi:MAG: hypothetical protein ACREH3_01335, partial [Geminicoccales bacterium]